MISQEAKNTLLASLDRCKKSVGSMIASMEASGENADTLEIKQIALHALTDIGTSIEKAEIASMQNPMRRLSRAINMAKLRIERN